MGFCCRRTVELSGWTLKNSHCRCAIERPGRHPRAINRTRPSPISFFRIRLSAAFQRRQTQSSTCDMMNLIVPIKRSSFAKLATLLALTVPSESFWTPLPFGYSSIRSSGFRIKDNDDDIDSVHVDLPWHEDDVDPAEVRGMTDSQLAQQLRLRGMPVPESREERMRLLLEKNPEADEAFEQEIKGEWVSTTFNKNFKKEPEINAPVSAEVWGEDARVLEDSDYDGTSLVVDAVRTMKIVYRGSNNTEVHATVYATRDALKPFLKGRATNFEAEVLEGQKKREKATKSPPLPEDELGLDEGDEAGIYKDILHRDYSDWGIYSAAGALMAAQQVAGVLLLSDVYGEASVRALARKMALECQPKVVMVPDLFNGQPWEGPTDGLCRGQTYEEWRSQLSEQAMSINIRVAAACLKQRFFVSGLIVWGTCFGGGKALETASGWVPSLYDVDGELGPPPVNPQVVVAWYPTRYRSIEKLFGGKRESTNDDERRVAAMAVFAGDDCIAGAKPEDAKLLKKVFEEDERISDHMVKVFNGQRHGFAHRNLGEVDTTSDPETRYVDDSFGSESGVGDDDTAEVAFLLSTAFMETYSRLFLPTAGSPISEDSKEAKWGQDVDMMELPQPHSRDVRKELEGAAKADQPQSVAGINVEPSNEQELDELIKALKTRQENYAVDDLSKIHPDDDLDTIYEKLGSTPGFSLW